MTEPDWTALKAWLRNNAPPEWLGDLFSDDQSHPFECPCVGCFETNHAMCRYRCYSNGENWGKGEECNECNWLSITVPDR